jgi:riboflavin synthase
MFTGLIEEIGRIARLESRTDARRFWIAADRALEGTARGDSIAVNGCCLTVLAIEGGRFAAEAVPETLRRTTLGALEEGEAVNLERSLRLDQRLGGHLVQGHVDAVGEVRRVSTEGDGRRIEVAIPAPLAPFVAEKGSISVDGTSLTVAALVEGGCEIAYIPHTLAATVAGRYAPGARVNLEVDLIARYLARLIDAQGIGRRMS